MVGDNGEGSLKTILDLLLAGNTRGVDIINTRADLVGVAILLEGLQQFHVTLGELNGDDVSIEALDRWEDVAEIGIAEVRVGLGGIFYTSSGEFEGVDSPLQVLVPVRPTERKLWA
jgi:hypothetical protein